MKPEDGVSQIIRDAGSSVEVTEKDLAQLRARISAAAAAEPVSPTGTPGPEPTRSARPKRVFALAAASAVVLGIGTWGTLALIQQPSSWADGVKIEPEQATGYIQQCVAEASVDNDEFHVDSNDLGALVWNYADSVTPKEVSLKTATIESAERRGDAVALWFTLDDNAIVGSCLVDKESTSAALQADASLSENPSLLSGFFSTYALREGSEGNIYADLVRFERTAPEFERYEAQFSDGTRITGTIQNGYLTLLNRVHYPNFDSNTVVSIKDSELKSITLYKADGTGRTTSDSEAATQ